MIEIGLLISLLTVIVAFITYIYSKHISQKTVLKIEWLGVFEGYSDNYIAIMPSFNEIKIINIGKNNAHDFIVSFLDTNKIEDSHFPSNIIKPDETKCFNLNGDRGLLKNYNGRVKVSWCDLSNKRSSQIIKAS